MFELVLVKPEEKSKFQKLVHEYLDEFKKYDPTLELINGEYDYPHFHFYFEDKTYYPMYLMIDDQIAGLAMVHLIHPKLYALTEFYLKKDYRHHENASKFVFEIFNKFDGNFTLSTPVNNEHGILFWDKIAGHFSYHKIKSHNKITWIIIQRPTKKI